MFNRYLKDVVTLEMHADKCTGCGICMIVCPHEVLALKNNKAEIIQKDACMECGACAMNCPFEAISVQAGVGCAAAMIRGKIKGGECSCDCDCC